MRYKSLDGSSFIKFWAAEPIHKIPRNMSRSPAPVKWLAARSCPPGARAVLGPRDGVARDPAILLDVEVEHAGQHEIRAAGEGIGEGVGRGIAPAAITLKAIHGFETVRRNATVSSGLLHQ